MKMLIAESGKEGFGLYQGGSSQTGWKSLVQLVTSPPSRSSLSYLTFEPIYPDELPFCEEFGVCPAKVGADPCYAFFDLPSSEHFCLINLRRFQDPKNYLFWIQWYPEGSNKTNVETMKSGVRKRFGCWRYFNKTLEVSSRSSLWRFGCWRRIFCCLEET